MTHLGDTQNIILSDRLINSSVLTYPLKGSQIRLHIDSFRLLKINKIYFNEILMQAIECHL